MKASQTTLTKIHRSVLAMVIGMVLLLGLLSWLEHLGGSRQVLGFAFLSVTVGVYAIIGIAARTNDPDEYYLAGRKIPAVYNGMATASDWMSAATFMGLAGTLYLSGWDGLSFVLGWTGGFCLVAFLLAPYLRRFAKYTLGDFLAERYESRGVRVMAMVGTFLCCFVYVVAQIYAVGLVMTRLTGVDFVVGTFLGLGGVLLCSFLGGMRAITWTQVLQYGVLLIAFVVPVFWLSHAQTGYWWPPSAAMEQWAKAKDIEDKRRFDPIEKEVSQAWLAKAQQRQIWLADVEDALAQQRLAGMQEVQKLMAEGAALSRIQEAEKRWMQLPESAQAAAKQWRDEQAHALTQAKALETWPSATHASSRLNFWMVTLCLMMGTASLPHLLMRFGTTPSVSSARRSVAWTLFFVCLLYFFAPSLAVLLRWEVVSSTADLPWAAIPEWLTHWHRAGHGLVNMEDVNLDGRLQWGELRISPDIVMLSVPEMVEMPFLVSALVAAGAMAAALSTADGLLLALSATLSHDGYYRLYKPSASQAKRVLLSKLVLLLVALAATYLASQRPTQIVLLVSAAFSVAAAVFFPALVLGIFWPRGNGKGALAGMVAGLMVTLYYLSAHHPVFRDWLNVETHQALWWNVTPLAAGVFGVAVGFVVHMAVSLLTAPPGESARRLLQRIHDPRID